MSENLYSNIFPSPIVPDEEKNQLSYGKRLGQAIYESSIQGSTSYYYQRNAKFLENRLFANGKQDPSMYFSLLGIQGKDSFLNLDYHPRPIAPKFRDILINTILERNERVEATALSAEFYKKKAAKKNDAAFRMTQGDFIQNIQQDSGVQFEQPDAYTPDSEEDLNLWYDLHEKEHEEILMEEGISFVFYNNDWNAIKREVVGDLVDNALACAQNYFDGCKRIRIRRVKPEYLVYGTTQTLDFRNVGYVGHMERMSIVDVRSMWPHIPEKELYDLASNWVSKYGNPNSLSDYNVDYQTAYTRPYDGFLIDVLFFEYKVTKYVDYVKGKDKNGRPIFDYRKGKATDTKEVYKKPIPTIYSGAWLIGSETVPFWGEMPNLLRSNEDTTDVKFSYSIFMLNNDGMMMPKSPIDEMKSSIIQMDLAILKIQQIMASCAPDGVRIDIEGIQNLDLGVGIGKATPLKLREIRLTTGDEYWSSKNMAGENTVPPIQDAIHNIGNKLEQFIGVYNFELNNIRDYIGVNEVRDGSITSDRIGLGVVNNQLKASNTATSHIYAGFISIMTGTAKSVSLRLWDALKQLDANEMYMRLLGQQNMDFIDKRMDITATNYDVMIQVNMSDADNAFLEGNIAAALQAGTIELEDTVVVRDKAKVDMKKAILYLGFAKKKREKEMQAMQDASAKQAQITQGQLVQAQAAQKIGEQKQMDQLELIKIDEKGKIERKNIQQQLISDALIEQMKSKAPLPEYVNALIAREIVVEAKEEEAEQMAEQQQMMQAQQAQMQQQQEGQPEMQDQEQMQPELQ